MAQAKLLFTIPKTCKKNIYLFAQWRVGAVFIVLNAEFHSFAVSLLKLSLAAFDLDSSFHTLMEVILIDFPPSFYPGLFSSS